MNGRWNIVRVQQLKVIVGGIAFLLSSILSLSVELRSSSVAYSDCRENCMRVQ